MAEDVEPTEITELDVSKVSAVTAPANGTGFLLVKSAGEETGAGGEPAEPAEKADAEKVNCNLCDGSGKIRAGKVDCPDCDASGKVSPQKASAQKSEPTLTPDPSSPGASAGPTDEPAGDAAKGEVQDALDGTKTPEQSGPTVTSTSGVSGPVTAGLKPGMTATQTENGLPGMVANLEGGESPYVIPAEAKINGSAVKVAAALFATSSLADAIAHIDEMRQSPDAVKADGDAAVADPGSPPWESVDSVTLQQVAQTLAHCGAAIDAIQKRETVEAASGDPSDWFDAWDLSDAQYALDAALGIAARLSFVEQASAQAAKSGAIDFERMQSAQENLTRTVSAGEQQVQKARDLAGSTTSKEDTIMAAEVTKEELAEAILAGTDSAVEAKFDAFKEQLPEMIAEAVKNANNGGDIDAASIKPNGDIDEHLSGLSKEVADSVTEQIGEVAKDVATLKDLMVKMGKRPRQGGPILDGQLRQVADEGRQGEVAKSEDEVKFELLEKQFAETSDPGVRAMIGEQLTRARLRAQAVSQFGEC